MKKILTLTAVTSLAVGLSVADGAQARLELPASTALHDEIAPASTADLAPVEKLPSLYIEETHQLGRGETLAHLLSRAGFSNNDIHHASTQLRRAFNLRSLRQGQPVNYSYALPQAGQNPDLLKLRLIDDSQEVIVERNDDNSFKAEVNARKLEPKLYTAAGTISDSLYMSANQAGVADSMIIPFIELFAWDIDFTRDIRKGDGFRIVYEALYDQNGEFVRYGDILAGELDLKSTTGLLHAFRADNGEYYDAKGLNKRRSLLRTPLKFARISSHFNPRRKHPILGYTRAHRGTDFAAPTGTPIKAAGNGRIVELGWKGGYGRYIRIRHNGTYQTAYAHMHRYGKGLKNGSHVKQGQVIGYVGTSGRSTGPHLHFELFRHGKQVNAMKEPLPAGEPLPQTMQTAFEHKKTQYMAMWENIPQNTKVAVADIGK